MSQTKAQLLDTLIASLLPASDSSVDIGSNTVRFANIYGDTLYGNGANLTGINTDLVSDTSPQLGGNLDVNTKNILFGDSASASDDRLIFGAGSDLQIYHDGSNSYVADVGTGNMNINGSAVQILNPSATEVLAKFIQNAAVELYYDNSKKFETVSGGATITGTGYCTGALIVGSGSDFQVTRDSGNTEVQNYNGTLLFGNASSNANNVFIRGRADENSIVCIPDGAVELYHNNIKMIETVDVGVRVGDSKRYVVGDDNDGYLRYNSNTVEIYVAHAQPFKVNLGSETALLASANGAVELYYDNSKKLDTRSGGVGISGDLFFVDSTRIYMGSSNDFQLFHDGTNSHIVNSTGNLVYRSDTHHFKDKDNGDTHAKFVHDGAVELYHDNGKVFSTESNGIQVLAKEGFSAFLRLYADEGDDNADQYWLKTEQDGTGFHIQNNVSGSTETNLRALGNGTTELFYDNSKKLETTSTGIYVDGDIDGIPDGSKILVGTHDDIQIFHQTNASYIKASNHTIHLDSGTTSAIKIISGGSTTYGTMANFNTDGAVELYYDGSKKFATKTDGVRVTGRMEAFPSSSSATIAGQFYNNSTGAGADCIVLIKTYANQGADPYIKFDAGGSDMIVGNQYGGTTNNKLVLGAGTSVSGGVAGLQIDGGGQITPDTNNARDLGSTSLRFRNVYTNDLNLSNEGGTNDIDGTWGSYTIQEGAEDLFLVNKRSGKKYKFNLTEVS